MLVDRFHAAAGSQDAMNHRFPELDRVRRPAADGAREGEPHLHGSASTTLHTRFAEALEQVQPVDGIAAHGADRRCRSSDGTAAFRCLGEHLVERDMLRLALDTAEELEGGIDDEAGRLVPGPTDDTRDTLGHRGWQPVAECGDRFPVTCEDDPARTALVDQPDEHLGDGIQMVRAALLDVPPVP
jgi:hypothetical protein